MATQKYDPAKIREAYEKAKGASQAERYAYERSWFLNCLYYLQIQWIIYSPQTRKWKPRKIAKWVPRPVTNKFASIANTVMQVLAGKSPDVRARPGSGSPEDVGAAAVADRNLDVLLKEAGDNESRAAQAAWLTLTGNVFVHPSWDNDPLNGTTFLQHLSCAKCGKSFAPDKSGPPVPVTQTAGIPSAGAGAGIATDLAAGANGASQAQPYPIGAKPELPAEPEMSEASCPFCGNPQLVDAVDEDAEPKGEELPTGRLNLETFSPFEVFVDLEARSMRDVHRLLVRRRYPVDVVRRKYNDQSIEADSNSNTGGAIGLNLLRAIAYASGSAMYGTGIASGRNLGDDQNVTVDQLWLRPCTDFPQGLVAIYVNDKLLNESTINDGLPYRDRKGKPIWPWHLKVFDQVPGRLLGRTPMDDVAPKQEQRNKLESLIQLIITRMASPHWLSPRGSGITELTGEPGQVIEYTAFDPRLKPELVFGAGPATSIIAWLEKIDKDMEEVAGVFEVLRGSAPPGVTAGTALRLLLERANTRFTPVLTRSEETDSEIYSDLLTIYQQFGSEERTNQIQGPGQTWEVERFTNADINGAVDVVVEAGSTIPKSTVGEQALIQDLVTMAVIVPTEPNTQYKILEKFGSTSLLGDVDLNIRAAQRENWQFINEQQVPVIDPVVDLHPVHVKIHKEYALTSDFKVLSEEEQGQWRNHIVEHMIAMMPAPQPMLGGPQSADSKGGPQAGANGNGSSPEPSGAPAAPPMSNAQQESAEPPMPGGE